MKWTDDKVETLKKLWAEGLSASQIASRLGEITRNAVIGKVHRLGLPGRQVAVRRLPSYRRKKPKKKTPLTQTGNGSKDIPISLAGKFQPKSLAFQEQPEYTPPFQSNKKDVDLMSLKNGQCKYPIKEKNGQHLFCGEPQKDGSPYCEHHHDICHVPVPRKKKNPHFRLAS